MIYNRKGSTSTSVLGHFGPRTELVPLALVHCIGGQGLCS